MVEKPVPQLLAMLICDTIIHDSKTRKKTVVGIFDTITCKKIPFTHHSLSIYIVLTEGIGEYEGELKLICEDDETALCELKGPLAFTERLQRVELEFKLDGLVFPHFGKYRFDFLCDGRLVKSRKFYIKEFKKK